MTNRDAIDILCKLEPPRTSKKHFDDFIQARDMAINSLSQPERIKGRWILAKEQRREDIENGNYMYNCSNCDCGDLHSKAVNVSYCWNCGADMRGVAE